MIENYLPFHIPGIGEEEIQSVVEILRSGWITTGAKSKQFEEEFSKYIGASHAVAVNSGTAALHLALDAVGVREKDEVIVPTMTFAATAEVVTYLKAKPILVDCMPNTLNIDHDQIEKAITPRTKAVMPVHFGGQACEMDRIMKIARNHNLKVIEDAAHAFPSRYKKNMVGTIGDITCFSFYATKTITTGEGGMATTQNPVWAERIRMMSLHGISKDAWNRYAGEGSWNYEIIAPGYKYNLTDIAAAIGIVQLKKADRMWKRRVQIAAAYQGAFRNLAEIELPKVEPQTEHSWHLFVIKLNLEKLGIDRDQFIIELKNKGIATSVHFIPLHVHPYYRDTYGYKPEDFPVAYAAYKRIISLPIYPKMGDGDVQRVIEAVKEVAAKSKS